MGVPISQMYTVARYVLGRKLRGVKRYPLVLMLEPLFRCNLACAGCGKIQHPPEILRKNLSPEDCFRAVEECGAPMVSIPGGEPLLHPQIDEIVAGLVERKKYIYLCTNAILLEKNLHRFTPTKYLSFSVHLDGLRDEHDEAVCREGVFDVAVAAIRAAIAKGFRVTTNTTLFNTADPERVRGMFDALAELGVEGMMLSPGYPYEKAPDQEHFLHRNETKSLFRRILAPKPRSQAGAWERGEPKRRWVFNQSPLFLEFLKGNFELECTPWGNPTYNVFGWQKPCYLLQEGYCETYQELLDATDWDNYGHRSGNAKCTDCMVHSGYEPSAVAATFGTLTGFLRTARTALFGPPADRPLPAAGNGRRFDFPQAPRPVPQLVELEDFTASEPVLAEEVSAG
jgi:hopanoid biosynthesis associated radical SAM protein HpnH